MQMRYGFEMVDKDRSGFLNFQEVHMAVSQSGYFISFPVLQQLMITFDRKKLGQLSLDDYIELSVFLGVARNVFQFNDMYKTGQITLNFEQFVRVASQLYQ